LSSAARAVLAIEFGWRQRLQSGNIDEIVYFSCMYQLAQAGMPMKIIAGSPPPRSQAQGFFMMLDNPINIRFPKMPQPAPARVVPAATIMIRRRSIVCLITLVLAVIAGGCSSGGKRPPGGVAVQMTVTAYCPCGKCCGWHRNWYGRPVFSSGTLKGKPKPVGITADGTRARKGVVAADTRHYPFGTRMYIPGYGMATVHDRGGAIVGTDRLDLFFPRHQQALQWGRQNLTVWVYP